MKLILVTYLFSPISFRLKKWLVGDGIFKLLSFFFLWRLWVRHVLRAGHSRTGCILSAQLPRVARDSRVGLVSDSVSCNSVEFDTSSWELV